MRCLFSILLLIVLCTKIQSQPYFNDGATWFYDLLPGDTNSYVKIEKTGEVWMAGKLCDELTFAYYNFSYSPAPEIVQHYTYASGDTIMIYNPGNATFGELYNFSH